MTNPRFYLTVHVVLLLLALNLNPLAGYAGARDTTGLFELKGRVLLNDQSPAAFFNVIALPSATSAHAVSTQTDAKGYFSMRYPYPHPFTLIVTYLAARRYTSAVLQPSGNTAAMDLGAIVLKESISTLDTVEVKSNVKLVERKIDRYVVNLEKSMVATGHDLIDAMQYLPGISVNENDQVKVNGKPGVIFMINGRRVYAAGDQLKSVLKSIQSDQVKSIEVITNPSARYDAEGVAAIINIVLKKSLKKGTSGDVSLSNTNGKKYRYTNANFNYKYQSEKFGIYSFLGANTNTLPNYYYVDRRYSLKPYPVYFSQSDTTMDKKKSISYRLESDYQINNRNLISFGANIYHQHTGSDYDANTLSLNYKQQRDSSFITMNNSTLNSTNVGANVNYQLKTDSSGSQLDIGYVFALFRDRKNIDYNTSFYDSNGNLKRNPDINSSFNPTNVDIHSFKIDYATTIARKHKLEMGAKASFIKTFNEIAFRNFDGTSFRYDSVRSSSFLYRENILAAYGNWNMDLKTWSFQAGLRVENTNTRSNAVTINMINRRNYTQLFPSLYVKKEIDKNNILVLSYTRRIQRPGYQSLNPLKYYYDPYFYEQGNPDLLPQKTHSLELNYTLQERYILTAGYQHTSDFIQTEFSDQNDTTRVFNFNTVNIDTYRSYYLALVVPFSLAKWWTSEFNFNYNNDYYKGVTFAGEVDKSSSNYSLRLVNRWELPARFSINLFTYYRSRRIDAQTVYDPYLIVSMSAGKSLWKEKANIRINVSDIFNTQHSIGVVDFANQYFKSRYYWDTRRVGISFIYKFSGGKKLKKRQSSNIIEDELDRVK